MCVFCSNDKVKTFLAEDKKSRSVSVDTMYHCDGCGCYGLASEFESPISCSPSCTEVIEAKKHSINRKEKDLKYVSIIYLIFKFRKVIHVYLHRDLRAKKKRKRLLQEQQWSKEMDDKSDEKDKAKSETDEEKDIASIDDESQGDSSESKVSWVQNYNMLSYS